MNINYLNVLKPEALVDTLDQLDAAAKDLMEKGVAKEKAYAEKGDLLKQRLTTATAIDLTESEAVMNIEGEARSQYVISEGKKIALTNEESRKAYMRMASKEDRKRLAEIDGDLAEIEVKVAQANDAWYTAKESSDKVQAKANLQAALLNFLAGTK